ncbi:LEAF RUST 10 DISEASE-RESISTANCE LOCUS RECEPTOR-LIKE PROTEIN KINASE-like 1.1 [Ipomoea triloba]|uniref:LEAF RUST 10 DISEASE-RESISTANCE LOCUS RECEPTOR-LIKE PROTEIN KINASE-like 1.1 n=1 Tax=Ipomoea triloba TaxID=35885 RepID=UPI00125D6F9E|nr:LEAF RUST 10 DISEASE-RESISTANCE LOCUS RECEPTOR-LIKE PROTEIN KINASE-like 1.1 [Ipomoea triloba]
MFGACKKPITLDVTPKLCYPELVLFAHRHYKSSKLGGFSIFFSKQDVERSSKYLGVPIFSYCELQKVTNNFDPSKELGEGGFGTVYRGKLGDGREVAVKRLYERNCKRMEQFVNEIKILTRLRHRNLVTLYGCSSRNSSSLLLVYEYIPNGTLADHLHGERAKHKSLTWPIRINIAIQTANALAYLHASDIIHRDVKTANILLDHNFAVKVADFGLSRLFPIDVTHVSTMPQGTPGYFDPEYYESYKLTDRSDVYSFGVVLAELISSMPAVDMDRDSHEINLANYAMNRILASTYDALVDPSLGFGTDTEVTRMTTSVAELAFRCLQPRKDMRPTMFDVLETLLEIQGGHGMKDEIGFTKCPLSPDTEEILLKTKFPTLPNSVTDKWICGTSTSCNSV